MLICVCLRILASSRIPRYDLVRQTPHFLGGSITQPIVVLLLKRALVSWSSAIDGYEDLHGADHRSVILYVHRRMELYYSSLALPVWAWALLVAAFELSCAMRWELGSRGTWRSRSYRGPWWRELELQGTWRLQSCPVPGDGSRGTRGYVCPSRPSSWLGACTRGYPIFRVPIVVTYKDSDMELLGKTYTITNISNTWHSINMNMPQYKDLKIGFQNKHRCLVSTIIMWNKKYHICLVLAMFQPERWLK
jgi:hypothetical protein